jgi:hyaluronoglucosaminidase
VALVGRQDVDIARVLAIFVALLALLPAAQAQSPFEWRGIVEGPYGRPWDHAQRERILRWMPSRGFNAYVHAPKDDVYQRSVWREPYPEAEQREFEAEIRRVRGRPCRPGA